MVVIVSDPFNHTLQALAYVSFFLFFLFADGFVAETNATNLFMVKHGILYTPHAHACLPGVTRHCIIHEIVPAFSDPPLVCVERNISLAEFHAADEVFTTGTSIPLSSSSFLASLLLFSLLFFPLSFATTSHTPHYSAGLP